MLCAHSSRSTPTAKRTKPGQSGESGRRSELQQRRTNDRYKVYEWNAFLMERALYDPPDRNLAVQWSEDNILAVASGCTIGLLNPCHPEAPRAVIDCGPISWSAQDPKCQPQEEEELAYRLNFWRRIAPDVQPDTKKTHVSSPVNFAWSTSGFGPGECSGCLLSLITSDGQVG